MDTIAKIDEQVNEAKGLAKFFEIDLTIKLFGHIILHYHYPPQNQN